MAFPRVLPDWMARMSQPAEVVANDQAALRQAENVVRVLAGGEGVVVPVQPVGHGWYRLRVEVAPTVLGDLVELLAEARVGALVGLGGTVEMVLLTLIHDGLAEELLVATAGLIPVPPGVELAPPGDEAVATLTGWLQAVGLPAGRRVTAERLLADMRRRKGSDALIGMLERLGLQVRDPERWWEELGGATWWLPTMEPSRVGLTQMHWRSQRWVVALGEDFYGLWDRERPERPVQTWPKNREGADAAERRLHELVVWPILRSTRLPGERVWCTSKAAGLEGPQGPVGWLAYRSPAGAAALIAAYDPPITRLLRPAGPVILIGGYSAAKAGFDRPRVGLGGHMEFPNRNLHDVETAFTADLAGTQASPWQSVPDTVPDDLLATMAYIREQTSQAATET
jgi:hypothetical protein